MPKHNLSRRYDRSLAARNDKWDKLFCDLFWSPFETKARRVNTRSGFVSYCAESTDTESEDDDVSIELSATSVSSSKVPLPPTDPQPSRPRCHPCRSCAKSFRFRYQRRNHEVVHSAERPWPCNCGKCFKSALALHMHRKRTGHHNWTVSCPRCGQCFAKTSDMKRHNASACAKFQAKKGV
ncbi:zinc finger protein 311 [Culex quinquefasciatus]|uniref:zinc finger protein 311 n=1 Tax=Culex quinquefasciatus TaxID=7176 RepID=UPI0018E2FF59|nr:zinc finger protein 311 [Culex quinquefasciatus]